jgi:hypothetical protein
MAYPGNAADRALARLPFFDVIFAAKPPRAHTRQKTNTRNAGLFPKAGG